MLFIVDRPSLVRGRDDASVDLVNEVLAESQLSVDVGSAADAATSAATSAATPRFAAGNDAHRRGVGGRGAKVLRKQSALVRNLLDGILPKQLLPSCAVTAWGVEMGGK